VYVERWLRKPERDEERKRERERGGEEEGMRESERNRERVGMKEVVEESLTWDGVRKRRPTGVEEDGNTSTESTLQALPLAHALPLAGVPT